MSATNGKFPNCQFIDPFGLSSKSRLCETFQRIIDPFSPIPDRIVTLHRKSRQSHAPRPIPSSMVIEDEEDSGILPFPVIIPNPLTPPITQYSQLASEYPFSLNEKDGSGGIDKNILTHSGGDKNFDHHFDHERSNDLSNDNPANSESEQSGLASSSRSSSFISLITAYQQPQSKDRDAGNRPLDHYKIRLPRWRNRVRNWMLPLIRWETPQLARLQTEWRNPFLDVFFALSANLGTHTFYVIMLPILFWFGMTAFGRDLVYVLAFGVYSTGVLKDLLCLPRPLSPPLHRLTMSGSAALEYGFPSTHTANAVSVGLLLFDVLRNSKDSYTPSTYFTLQLLNIFYVLSIAAGRIYCGMHGFLDVVSGAFIGTTLWWIRVIYRPQMDEFNLSSSSWVLSIIPIILILIRTHPEPADDCPCFDDAVAFLGVVAGTIVGEWKFIQRDIPYKAIGGDIHYSFKDSGVVGTVLRIVLGIAVISVWRATMKRTLLDYLPPLFRLIDKVGLSMPRRFFTPASEYKDVPNELPDGTMFEPSQISSIFNNLGRNRGDSVGPQSTADVYESLAYREFQKQKAEKATAAAENGNTVSFRGNKGEVFNSEPNVSSSSATPKRDYGFGSMDHNSDELLSTVVIPRVRYDVEVITKVIVYFGIAYITTDSIGCLFYFLGI